MTSPLLSILIPTKDRAEGAVSSIATALSLPSSDVEVIVHDNSGDRRLENALAGLPDGRLRYYHVSQPMDVVANFSAATELSRGEYVTAIGDDDGVTSSLVEATQWGADHDADAIVSTRPAQYYWPDLKFRYYGSAFSGTLEIRSFTGAVSLIEPQRELQKCLDAAGSRLFNLPRVYYGCVRRSCLERVREYTGRYYPGPSPDVSSAVAVSKWVKRAYCFDYPLFVPGSSRQSTAGLGAAKLHHGRLEDFPHLPAWSLKDWSEMVPRFFSGPTIWAEDVVHALVTTGQENLLGRFNIPLLYALCLTFHPGHYREILKRFPAAARQGGHRPALMALATLCQAARVTSWRGRAAVRRLAALGVLHKCDRVVGLPDIRCAVDSLNERLSCRRQRLTICDC
jgi:hypothetical protein